MPPQLAEYVYRKEFGLSAEEFAMEPVDRFYTNLVIRAQIQDKRNKEAEHAG